MNLDTHTDHNPDAPWNQVENEPLSELEQLQEDYTELIEKVKTAKKTIAFCLEITGDNVFIYKKLKSIKL